MPASQTMQYHNPEIHKMKLHHRENMKSYKSIRCSIAESQNICIIYILQFQYSEISKS
jgi:hypothetical protein